MATARSKAELTAAMQEERGRWEALLRQVGEERMNLPGASGEWSVKDVVAHLTVWESRPVAWLEAVRAGTWPEPPPWPANLDEPQINDWIYRTNRGRSALDVLNESRQTFDRLAELVAATPEPELVEQNRFEWLRGSSLADSIGGNSYEHYREHGDNIRRWLRQLETPVGSGV